MKIDFNNVRKQAIYAYEDLVEKLNEAIITDEQYARPSNTYHKQEMPIKGYVLVHIDDIRSALDELRGTIGSIAMTYRKDDESFKDVFQEIYPEDNQSMSLLKEEEELFTNN